MVCLLIFRPQLYKQQHLKALGIFFLVLGRAAHPRLLLQTDVGRAEAQGAVLCCLGNLVSTVDVLSFRIEILANRVRPGMEQPYVLILVLEGSQDRGRFKILVQVVQDPPLGVHFFLNNFKNAEFYFNIEKERFVIILSTE